MSERWKFKWDIWSRTNRDSVDSRVFSTATLTSSGRLRLRTLIHLRWMAVLGQSLMLGFVAFGLGFPVPLGPAAVIILASCLLNLYLSFSTKPSEQIKPKQSALQLGFDALQLGLLLGVTGGMSNPFSLMLIAPPTVAAANLPLRQSVVVAVTSLVVALLIYRFALPLPWHALKPLVLPELYRLGFLAAVFIGIIFTATYSALTALEAARMETALEATRAVLEKEHRMSALGALAASAAHELGTPLGTMQLVAREMTHALTPDHPLYDDVQLILSQSQRCRDILKSLSQRPDRGDVMVEQMILADFIDGVIAPFKTASKIHYVQVLSFESNSDPVDVSRAITIKRRPQWIHALSAFVENATDFAESQVWVRVEIHKAYISLTIEDDGPGFSADILPHLGSPYVTSRSFDELDTHGKSHSGMGLGFFIAKTLVESSGARLSFGNLASNGAYIKALWRRDQVDIIWAEPGPKITQQGQSGTKPS